MNTATRPLLQTTAASDSDWQELQRFAGLGRLSASLLHEISNPLTAASLHLEQYNNQAAPSIRHARRSIELMRRYVEAARQQVRQESVATGFSVGVELGQVRRFLAPLAQRHGVRLDIRLPVNYRLFGDPVKFQQIVANLITNAIDAYRDLPASNSKHSVTITVTSRQPWLVIEVTDRAKGIPADALPQLFQPFYTTKDNGRGLGIGLAIVKQYVETDFHGSLNVSSSSQTGTRFRVKLRAAPQPKIRPRPQVKSTTSGAY